MRGAGARVRVACDPGGFVAREVRPLGSGNLRSMVHANGLAIVPEGQAVAEASDSVAVMLLGPPDAEGEDEATIAGDSPRGRGAA